MKQILLKSHFWDENQIKEILNTSVKNLATFNLLFLGILVLNVLSELGLCTPTLDQLVSNRLSSEIRD